jgi:hypothetical protein
VLLARKAPVPHRVALGGSPPTQMSDHAVMRFLGIDLAWGEGSAAKPANRSGVVAIDEEGQILDAGWCQQDLKSAPLSGSEKCSTLSPSRRSRRG